MGYDIFMEIAIRQKLKEMADASVRDLRAIEEQVPEQQKYFLEFLKLVVANIEEFIAEKESEDQ